MWTMKVESLEVMQTKDYRQRTTVNGTINVESLTVKGSEVLK